MRALANLTVVKKIYAVLGLMLLLVVGVSGTLIWTFKDTDSRYNDLLSHEVRAVVDEMRLRGALQSFARQMDVVLLLQKPLEGLADLEKTLAATSEGIDRYIQSIDDHDDGHAADMLAVLRAALPQIRQASAATLAIKRSNDPDQDAKARASWGSPTGRALALKLYADLAASADVEMKRIDAVSDDYTDRTNRTAILSATVIGLGLVGAAILSFLVATRGITRPLSALGASMRRLADQDLTAEVPGTLRRDEIGAMAKTVQVFKDTALRTRALEEEQARDRRAAEEARTGFEAQRAAAAEAASVAVGSIGAGLERLAAGDLTCRLDQGFAAEYERLRTDFNAAVGQLRDAMGGILANTAAIRSGTGEIANAADDLSRRTEQQAASLEETAAALDEITATVKRTADGSNQARVIVANARTDAEQSGAIVRDAVTAMGEIEKSSQQIGQIIGVIDEIAFQTNLLALNAGVEAARAGDAGRGFAVVAQEVRALAQRSAEAAKEIKALISTSTQHVSQGVKLVGETGQALGRIVGQVSEISATIVEIASSAQEQATGLHQVNAAVNQMDQVTQQNAAMVEQSTAASHALSQEAEELARLTARFKAGGPTDGQAASPAKAAPRPSNVAPLRPSARKAAPGRMSALPAASRDGTARKLAPVEDAEGWTEF